MMLSKCILAAMELAQYRILPDRSFHGRITGFQGVWANEKTLESCRRVLQEVLEEWIVLKLRDHDLLPSVRAKTRKVPVASRAWSALQTRLDAVPPSPRIPRPVQRRQDTLMSRSRLKLRIPNPHRREIGVPLLREIHREAGIDPKDWE